MAVQDKPARGKGDVSRAAVCLACGGRGGWVIDDGLEMPYTRTCLRCEGSGREPAHCPCGSVTHSACGRAGIDLGALDVDDDPVPGRADEVAGRQALCEREAEVRTGVKTAAQVKRERELRRARRQGMAVRS